MTKVVVTAPGFYAGRFHKPGQSYVLPEGTKGTKPEAGRKEKSGPGADPSNETTGEEK